MGMLGAQNLSDGLIQLSHRDDVAGKYGFFNLKFNCHKGFRAKPVHAGRENTWERSFREGFFTVESVLALKQRRKSLKIKKTT